MARPRGSARRLRRCVLTLVLAGACSWGGDPDRAASGASATDAGSAHFGNADASAQGSPNGTTDGAVRLPDGAADACKKLEVRNVDLLFVVDDSGSMREEQASLRREFPALIRALTTGDRDHDGIADFPPVEDLHLGVVSSDMGLGSVMGIPGCLGVGDDGVMSNTPGASASGCATTYPRFLSFVAGSQDADQTAADFACIADLGTDGCGFEQQLEAGLKALWRSTDDRVRFVGDGTGLGELGHGDVENAGFLRPASGDDTSLLAIVVVTDEEDCSSADTHHFIPEGFLPEDDPLRQQDLNLRCFYNPDELFPVSRYADGFRALREGNEQLVVFGAIVGVPPDLVDERARSSVDFGDAAARDAYYDAILESELMQEVEDPTRTPEQGGSLRPSCITDSGRAFPPRRIVQLAKEFGENAIVQSICQDDFGPAIDVVVDTIGRTIDQACLVE